MFFENIREEKIQDVLFIMYFIVFEMLLFLFYPLAHYICSLSNIPYDLTLTINSIGFGNELVLLLAIVGTIMIHFFIKSLSKLLLYII